MKTRPDPPPGSARSSGVAPVILCHDTCDINVEKPLARQYSLLMIQLLIINNTFALFWLLSELKISCIKNTNFRRRPHFRAQRAGQPRPITRFYHSLPDIFA